MSVYVGLMSGTSLDGISAAVVRFADADRDARLATELLAFTSTPYSVAQRDRIHAALTAGTAQEYCRLGFDLGEWLATAAAGVLAEAGVPRAEVATDLAMIQLMNKKPEKALQAINASRTTILPAALNAERRLLEARALMGLGRYDHALEVMATDKTPEGRELRADIAWKEKDWASAASQLEGLLGVGGEGVDLAAQLVERADQPLPAHPALADLAAGADRDVGLPREPHLGEVLLDLGVQPRGRDRAVVAPEGRPEDRDDDRGLPLVEQLEGGLREGALDPRQLGGDLVHGPPLASCTYRYEGQSLAETSVRRGSDGESTRWWGCERSRSNEAAFAASGPLSPRSCRTPPGARRGSRRPRRRSAPRTRAASRRRGSRASAASTTARRA